MTTPVIVRKEVANRPLNILQDLFCKIYATDPECLGNGTYAYMKAYKCKSIPVAQMGASRLLSDSRFSEKINEYLDKAGFNDQNVDKQHLFVINQHKDLNVKMKGIEHYNKLKKRIENKLELVMPKPIMELDDDETIRKFDKSKAKEIQGEEIVSSIDDNV